MVVARRAFVLFLLISTASPAGTLTATVSSTTVYNGVPFSIVVEAMGLDIGDFSVPSIEGATINKTPMAMSIKTVSVNGALSMSKTFEYRIRATRTGPLTIPPFRAEIDGTTVTSAALEVTVTEAPAQAPSGRQQPTRRTLTAEEILFTEIRTDKLTVYKGEPLTLTMELWLYSQCSMTMLPGGAPEVTGFYAVPREPIAPERNSERYETRDDRNYVVRTYTQTLYPTNTGTLRIGPWTVAGFVSAGSRPVEMERQTEPILITVEPLPEPPPNFSGSVGHLRIRSELRKNQTEPGVPATYLITIEGTGNPDAIGKPILPEIPDAYVDEPRRAARAGAFPGEFRIDFAYAVTPAKPGNLVIPAIDYCYFDTESRRYQTSSTQPANLVVLGIGKPESQIVVGEGGAAGSDSESLNGDILPIVTAATLGRPMGLTVPTVCAVTLPLLGYFMLAIHVTRQRRFATDIRFARAHRALRTGLSRLGEGESSQNPLDELYRTVASYLSDEFNLPESGMTSADARQLFAEQEVPEDIAGPFIRILKSCERARYAAAALSPEERRALFEGAQAAMERLNGFMKSRDRS